MSAEQNVSLQIDENIGFNMTASKNVTSVVDENIGYHLDPKSFVTLQLDENIESGSSGYLIHRFIRRGL